MRRSSVSIPYIWTHCDHTPPGLSRVLPSSRKSFVNRFATPEIHGFDGSLTITS